MNNSSSTTTTMLHHHLQPQRHASTGPTLHLRGGRAPPPSTPTSIRPSLLETAVTKLQAGLGHTLTAQERRALRDSAHLPPVDGVSDEEVRAMSAAAAAAAAAAEQGVWWVGDERDEEEEEEARVIEEAIWGFPEGLSEWWAGIGDGDGDGDGGEEVEWWGLFFSGLALPLMVDGDEGWDEGGEGMGMGWGEEEVVREVVRIMAGGDGGEGEEEEEESDRGVALGGDDSSFSGDD